MSAALIPPKLDTKKKIFWLITLVIPAIILFIPVTETFTQPIKMLLNSWTISYPPSFFPSATPSAASCPLR